MNELIPYKKDLPTKQKKEDLSPATLIARITPFRVTDLPDRTLYEFARIPEASKKAANHEIAVNGASAASLLQNSKIRKNCAYIAVMKNCKSFQISFFPDDESPQIINNLSLSELPRAIEDLKQIGF